jgi:hypothetical protein
LVITSVTKPRIREATTPTLSDFDKKHSKTRTIAPTKDGTEKTVRKFIEVSSSEDDLPTSKLSMKPDNSSPTKRRQKEQMFDSPVVPNRLDIRMTDDGTVE